MLGLDDVRSIVWVWAFLNWFSLLLFVYIMILFFKKSMHIIYLFWSEWR